MVMSSSNSVLEPRLKRMLNMHVYAGDFVIYFIFTQIAQNLPDLKSARWGRVLENGEPRPLPTHS